MQGLAYYDGFQQKALDVKLSLTAFLFEQKKTDKKVVAYGAAAKGNTLLNYCGIKSDLLVYVLYANPHERRKWLPASHIPVITSPSLPTYPPHLGRTLPCHL